MADDWFRSPDWSPTAQADFEARLRRSRDWNHAQYLRIKGLALREAGLLHAARSLWERIIEQDLGYDFEKAGTLEHLGDSYRDTEPERATQYYRRLLAEHPTLSGTTATVEIALAEVEMAKGRRADTDEALALLNSFLERGRSQFPSVLFRWHLVLIDIAQATGEAQTVQRAARVALDLAARGPVFSRHRDVGVVHADRQTMRRLRRLAT
ncbi:tetratricopeptide repeat protein [Phycicoccus sp.]|uniref:tetratricopeptide repeat protein n=1 Tax=Phycicoccus sp. TaxID=1902410 RepID=UPI002D1BE637|nr:tetratricopeptide repeat protein [Phycicoccus sp.]HMM96420.1 tetratricopeptide repeat protein [Phycicoccus sp.]